MQSKTFARRRNALLALSVLALVLALAIGFHPTTLSQGMAGVFGFGVMVMAGAFAAGCLTAFADILLPGQTKPWYVRKGAVLLLLIAVPLSLVLMGLLDAKLYVLLRQPESLDRTGRLLIFLCSELFLTAVADLALANSCDESSWTPDQPDATSPEPDTPWEPPESDAQNGTEREASRRANRFQTQNRLHR